MDSTCGPNCATREGNVEQDHGFGGDGCRTRCRPGTPLRAVVHPFQHSDRKAMPAGLLRKQNLLRYIVEEHSSNVASACEEWLHVGAKCDVRAIVCNDSAARTISSTNLFCSRCT